jgi:hypothetical protein
MMSKRTVWFLIIFLGASLTFLFTIKSPVGPDKLLGDVGVSVGIAPNPYNTLATQLDQEQTQLSQESADLTARENALGTNATQDPSGDPAIVWYLAIAVTFIGILVLLNFYLDWRRLRRIAKMLPVPSPQDPLPKE